jgi:hypothetical protein
MKQKTNWIALKRCSMMLATLFVCEPMYSMEINHDHHIHSAADRVIALDEYSDAPDAQFIPCQKNQINIYIWEPHGDAVGHMALRVAPGTNQEFYVSAWPDGFQTFEQDQRAEGGLPHREYTIFTDDHGIANMRAEWQNVRPAKGAETYGIFASVCPKLRKLDVKENCNCITMALHLLNSAAPKDPDHFDWPFSERKSSGIIDSYVNKARRMIAKNDESVVEANLSLFSAGGISAVICYCAIAGATLATGPVGVLCTGFTYFFGAQAAACFSGLVLIDTAVIIEALQSPTPSSVSQKFGSAVANHLRKFRLKKYREFYCSESSDDYYFRLTGFHSHMAPRDGSNVVGAAIRATFSDPLAAFRQQVGKNAH